jgi:hypothetical protein
MSGFVVQRKDEEQWTDLFPCSSRFRQDPKAPRSYPARGQAETDAGNRRVLFPAEQFRVVAR